MTACAGYAMLLLVSYAFCAAVWGTDARGLDDQLRNHTADIEASKGQLVKLRRQLEQGMLKLEANRAVGDQPDWSVLLTVLARSLDDQLVLTRCHLGVPAKPSRWKATPAPRGTAAASADEHGKFVLTISGFGRSQAVVSRFVLRLEKVGLFRTVNLLQANREPFRSGSAVAFRVECLL